MLQVTWCPSSSPLEYKPFLRYPRFLGAFSYNAKIDHVSREYLTSPHQFVRRSGKGSSEPLPPCPSLLAPSSEPTPSDSGVVDLFAFSLSHLLPFNFSAFPNQALHELFFLIILKCSLLSPSFLSSSSFPFFSFFLFSPFAGFESTLSLFAVSSSPSCRQSFDDFAASFSFFNLFFGIPVAPFFGGFSMPTKLRHP